MYLGGGLLLDDPTAPLAVVPIGCGVFLLIHAWHTTHLSELGYAIMWLWTAILAISVGTGVLTHIIVVQPDPEPLSELTIARGVGTVGLSTVLITAYTLLIWRNGNGSRSGPSSR